MREPAGTEGQHHRRGHAAQLPPLHPPVQAFFDAQRCSHLLAGNRLLQQLPMQLTQFLALHTPRMNRGLRLRVGCDAQFELGRRGGRQSPVDKRVQLFVVIGRAVPSSVDMAPPYFRRLRLVGTPCLGAAAPSISSRSRVRARDRRDMTVPIGMFSTLAASS